MDAFKVIESINKKLSSQNLPPLTDRQRLIVRAAWNNTTYEEALKVNPICTAESLRVDATKFWPVLSSVLSAPIGKRNFREVLAASDLLSESPLVPPPPPVAPPAFELPRFYGLVLPSRFPFYGRPRQVAELGALLQSNRCVCLTGIAGIGKRSLLWQTLNSVPIPYSNVVWQSLSVDQRPAEIARNLVKALRPQQVCPEQDAIFNLIEILRCEPHLVVLDQVDVLLIGTMGRSRVLPRGVRDLLYRILQETPAGLVLVSQFPLRDVDSLILNNIPAQQYPVHGLNLEAARQILGEYNLDDESLWDDLILATGGHPLLLRQLASWSANRRGRSLKGFESLTYQLAEVEHFYDRLFFDATYLSESDRRLLELIANRGSISEAELLGMNVPQQQLDGLQQSALVTITSSDGLDYYSMPPLLRKYLQKQSGSGAPPGRV